MVLEKGSADMATKSISNNVKMKDDKLCRGLANALESARKKKSKEVIMSQKVIHVSPDRIKNLLENK